MTDKKKQSVIISIRINGGCTSISVRKNILALWVLLMGIDYDVNNDWKKHFTDFVYKCADKWNGKSAKGFSEFVTLELIRSFLGEADSAIYNEILENL